MSKRAVFQLARTPEGRRVCRTQYRSNTTPRWAEARRTEERDRLAREEAEEAVNENVGEPPTGDP